MDAGGRSHATGVRRCWIGPSDDYRVDLSYAEGMYLAVLRLSGW